MPLFNPLAQLFIAHPWIFSSPTSMLSQRRPAASALSRRVPEHFILGSAGRPPCAGNCANQLDFKPSHNLIEHFGDSGPAGNPLCAKVEESAALGPRPPARPEDSCLLSRRTIGSAPSRPVPPPIPLFLDVGIPHRISEGDVTFLSPLIPTYSVASSSAHSASDRGASFQQQLNILPRAHSHHLARAPPSPAVCTCTHPAATTLHPRAPLWPAASRPAHGACPQTAPSYPTPAPLERTVGIFGLPDTPHPAAALQAPPPGRSPPPSPSGPAAGGAVRMIICSAEAPGPQAAASAVTVHTEGTLPPFADSPPVLAVALCNSHTGAGDPARDVQSRAGDGPDGSRWDYLPEAVAAGVMAFSRIHAVTPRVTLARTTAPSSVADAALRRVCSGLSAGVCDTPGVLRRQESHPALLR